MSPNPVQPLTSSTLYGRPIDTEQTRCDTPPLLNHILQVLLTVALVLTRRHVVSLSLPSTNVGAENFLVNRSIEDSTRVTPSRGIAEQ